MRERWLKFYQKHLSPEAAGLLGGLFATGLTVACFLLLPLPFGFTGLGVVMVCAIVTENSGAPILMGRPERYRRSLRSPVVASYDACNRLKRSVFLLKGVVSSRVFVNDLEVKKLLVEAEGLLDLTIRERNDRAWFLWGGNFFKGLNSGSDRQVVSDDFMGWVYSVDERVDMVDGLRFKLEELKTARDVNRIVKSSLSESLGLSAEDAMGALKAGGVNVGVQTRMLKEANESLESLKGL